MPLRRKEGSGVSWLTTCPHCGTIFRVGQEQLDAHQGEVRCGKCQRVFNATLSLKTEAEITVPEAETQEILVEEITIEAPAGLPPPDEEEAVADTGEAGVQPIPEEEPVLPEAVAGEAGEEPEAIEAPAEVAEAVSLGAEPSAEAAAEIAEAAPAQEASAEEETAEPPKEEKPRRRLGWLWGLGGVVLASALTAQSLYVYRAEIAARAPAARPLLLQMCGILQCRVGLPRHIELLGIDNSDLQADPLRPSVLVLNAVLRSRAPVPQEYPLLELTLTDAADQALLRRVFVPAEYLPKGKDAAAGIAGPGEVAIKLNLQVSELQPVGYRLYLFYPKAD
jgi:predicted Zn finger-like uncharacterized protein